MRSPRAEAAGEQGEHYDPLFTYREGDEDGYFAVSEESGGDAADVGPSGAGTSKGSPVTSSSLGGPQRVQQVKVGRPSVLTLPKTFLWILRGLKSLLKDFRERLRPRQSR